MKNILFIAIFLFISYSSYGLNPVYDTILYNMGRSSTVNSYNQSENNDNQKNIERLLYREIRKNQMYLSYIKELEKKVQELENKIKKLENKDLNNKETKKTPNK